MECAEWRGFLDSLDAEEERRGTVAIQNAGASLDDQGGVLAGFERIAEKFGLAVRCKKARYHAGFVNAERRVTWRNSDLATWGSTELP